MQNSRYAASYQASTMRFPRLEEKRSMSNDTLSNLWTEPVLMYALNPGNFELLEANTARHEILPGRREPFGKVTPRFHAGLFGGKE